MRVAIVHDWLYCFGGAERVLRGIIQCFPNADIYCLFDLLSQADRRKIGYKQSTTSFLQWMPFIRRHTFYLPLMPFAIEQFDLTEYDIIISSSFAVAKGVVTGPDQLHISYVHSPMRYAWDMQHIYLEESGLTYGLRSLIARYILHRLRIWDIRTVNSVDAYVANSCFISRRIQKLYRRNSKVIHPPVAVPRMAPKPQKERFFLTASRLVQYKNVRVIVEAFKQLPDEQLIVVGTGPELKRLKETASSNVTFLGFVEDAERDRLMAAARAFIFAAQEDFGIVVVEAQAQGTPVIALGKGGAREIVIAHGTDPTGLFFAEAQVGLINEAVREFIQQEDRFTPFNCHRNALRFSEEHFASSFKSFVEEHWSKVSNAQKVFSERSAAPESKPPSAVAAVLT